MGYSLPHSMIFARLFVVAEGVVAFMMFSGVSFILQGCEQVDEEPLPESLIRNPTDWEPSCAIQTTKAQTEHSKAQTCSTPCGIPKNHVCWWLILHTPFRAQISSTSR